MAPRRSVAKLRFEAHMPGGRLEVAIAPHPRSLNRPSQRFWSFLRLPHRVFQKQPWYVDVRDSNSVLEFCSVVDFVDDQTGLGLHEIDSEGAAPYRLGGSNTELF